MIRLAIVLLLVALSACIGPGVARADLRDWESGCKSPAHPPSGPWESDPDTGARTLRKEVDVDGDGTADEFVVTRSSGSGFSSTTVRIRMAGSGRTYEAEATFSFYSMIDRVPMPDALRGDPESLAARAWIETVMFGTICERPDPSLAWLLREPRSLEWHSGLPPRWMWGYAIRDTASGEPVWIHYKGSEHMYEPVSSDPNPTGVPPSLGRGRGDSRGALALIETEHGVILVDRAALRHAWLYVFPGAAGHKLRWPSVKRARFEADCALIEVERRGADPARGRVRVNLDDGSLVEEWTPLVAPSE